MEGQNCWERYGCIWKVILEWFIAGDIETRYLSFLVRESKCMPQGGTEGVGRIVIGCMQCNGWKITSSNPNGDQSVEVAPFAVGLFIYIKVTITCRWHVTVTESSHMSLRSL